MCKGAMNWKGFCVVTYFLPQLLRTLAAGALFSSVGIVFRWRKPFYSQACFHSGKFQQLAHQELQKSTPLPYPDMVLLGITQSLSDCSKAWLPFFYIVSYHFSWVFTVRVLPANVMNADLLPWNWNWSISSLPHPTSVFANTCGLFAIAEDLDYKGHHLPLVHPSLQNHHGLGKASGWWHFNVTLDSK